MKTRTTTHPMQRALCSALMAALLCTLAGNAAAFAPFKPAPVPERTVFCDMAEIKGQFSQTDARYTAKGTCVQLATIVGEPREGRNYFPDYNNAKELFRVTWTAEVGYDRASKEAWETITVPPPRIDEPGVGARPYGRVIARRTCNIDPWLAQGSVRCTDATLELAGNLGEAAQRLNATGGPFTRVSKALQYQALLDSHELYQKRYGQAVTPNSKPGRVTQKLFALPEIILPPAGSTQPPQTPMRIRVAAPKGDHAKVQSYQLQLENKQAGGDWVVATNIPVSAAEVEGPLGYNGWGWHQPGTGPAMTAAPGVWRIRAQATAPIQGEPGAWREFTVAGDIGKAPDEFQVNKTKLSNAKSRDLVGGGAAGLASTSALANGRSTAPGKGLAPASASVLTPVQAARASTSLTTAPAGTGSPEGAALDWGKAVNPAAGPARSR